MWEALCDRARFIPVPRLITVLVLDEHFGADLERCQVPGRLVRLFPEGD